MKITVGFNRWIRTRHIAVNMKTFLDKTLSTKVAPSTHKESTPSGIRRHSENVMKLKNVILNDYAYDFFGNESLKAITTGKQVPADVVEQMISSSDIGNDGLKKFVKDRLVDQKTSFLVS